MWIFLRSGDLPVSQPRVQPRVRHQELLIGAATSSVKQYYLTDVSTPDMHEPGNEARRVLVSFRDMHESLGNEARRALVSFPDMHALKTRRALVSFPDMHESGGMRLGEPWSHSETETRGAQT